MLWALESAGFKGHRLHNAYNAMIAALLGYVTLELAPAPQDDDWCARFSSRINALSTADFPRIAKYRPAMLNRAFILRWSSGVDVPLGGGFKTYVDAFLLGLKTMANQT